MSAGLKRTLFGLFFLSGFCGLLYQLVWTRLAFASFGVVTPVLSVVISVFMLGLSVGSWAGGKWVGWLSRRLKLSAIKLYALAELLIGVGAFVVPWLFSAGETILLRTGESDSFLYLVFSAAAIAAAVFPWCVCMGATFPFMLAFLQQVDRSAPHGRFSFLYQANVLGALTGTVVTVVVLVELLGFRHTLWVAGVSNAVIAAVAWAIGQRSACLLVPTPTAVAPDVSAPSAATPPLTKTILFTTGLSSMGMEVVWTRGFTPVLLTRVYSFAAVLFVYLLATWVGASLYRAALRRQATPSNATLLTWLAMFAFLPIVLNDARIGSELLKARFWIGLLAALSLFPFCAALGFLTPRLIDDYSNGQPLRASRAYAFNVLGCILGPLAACYILLPNLGVTLSLVALAVPFPVFMGLSWNDQAPLWRGVAAVITSIFVLSALFIHTSYEDPVGRSTPTHVVRRDHTATVISSGEGMEKRLWVNGISVTGLGPISKFMAHLPLAFHAGTPESALVLCFGMGTTYRSLLSWGIRATAVELVPSVRDAFGYYVANADEILQDPNGQVVIDDGRRYLQRTNESFDVITIDPPPPPAAAGSSLLYSEELYRDVKRHLKAGGIVQQWFPGTEAGDDDAAPLQAAARSLAASFPYVRVYQSVTGWGFHFLASMSPIRVPSAAALVARFPKRARDDLLEWSAGQDPYADVDRVLKMEIPLDELLSPDPRVRITDDQPFNEYFLLRWWGVRQFDTLRVPRRSQ